MRELREQIVVEVRLRGYSKHTERSYASRVQRFLNYVKRPVHEVEAEHVRDYMLHLHDRGLKPGSRKVDLAAIKFLFNYVLYRPEVAVGLVTPRARTPLPKILSHSEVLRVFAELTSIRCRVAAMTIYATGMRLSEVLALKASDIDSRRMLVHIREGKGGFDRFVPLTPKLLHVLRAYWVVMRPSGDRLFPSIRSFKHALAPKTLRTALRRAGKEAGLDKPVRPHVLRHTYATHMLELGLDIRELQVLLGHQSIQTTTLYTQVSTQHITRLKSPLDVSPQEALLLG